jgi:DNA repair exonuclease SbcCD ATPase subunit
MKIDLVDVVDFLSVGDATFSLDSRGLVLIQGRNEDNPSASSNGAGKSSLVDAVCWGLFGETARGVAANEVIRQGAKKALVRVLLVDEDGTVYLVERERTKTKMTLSLGKSRTPGAPPPYDDLTGGTLALTQAALNKILGCGPEVFRSAVYLGQDAMPDLPALTDKKLKELIEEAAGVGILEAAYAKARERCLTAERGKERAELLAKAATERLGRAVDEIGRLEIADKGWGTVRSSRTDMHWLEAERLTTEMSSLTALPAFSLKSASVDVALAGVEVKLAGFAAEQARERELLVQQGKADRGLAAVTEAFRRAMAELKDAELEATRLEGRVGEPCDACGHPLDAHALAHALAGARAKLAARQAEGRKIGAALRETQAEARAAGEALAAHRSTMGDPSTLQAHAGKLREALRQSEEIRRKHAQTCEARDRALDAMRSAEAEPNPYTQMLEDKRRERESAGRESEHADSSLRTAVEEWQRLQSVVKVFGPAGVRAHVLDQVTPYLNDRTAAYLDALSDATLKASWVTLTKDAKGNLKERFCIEVTHPAGEGFAALSGGEKRKVRIACALALQDLVASRATKPMRLWVADEIDDALDTAGLERLMGVLQSKAKERGTVLVISHRDLRDWIPDVWTLTKKAGVSELEAA